MDVALQVGAPSEQVLVVASSIALERDSTAVGTVVENTQVVNLPLDGRNFLEPALLAPGPRQPPRDWPARCAATSRSRPRAGARTPTASCSTAWTTSTRS